MAPSIALPFLLLLLALVRVDAQVVTAGGDFQLQSALAGGLLPVFNANFSVNPITQLGLSSAGYSWTAFDANDTAANQGLHQGLLVLDGLTQFVNISTMTGPNSIGLLAPTIGGPSSGTGATQGWSFEFVWKPTGNSNTWAKLLDMGNGEADGYLQTTNDDWTIGFDGNDQTEFLVETYNSATPAFSHAYVQLRELQLYTWYHMVVVNTPVGNAGGAVWSVYMNGVMENWASVLNGNQPATTTPQQGANYPQPVVRGQSYIGKSNWNDPLLKCVVDSVRIYDYALSATQVANLAALYNLNQPSPYSPPGATAPGYTASGAEYSIYTQAGINFAPYFNAPFASNPASYVGGSTGYTWLPSDPTDSPAQQALHTGLLQMNTAATSYVDLTLATGPQSIGQTLPILFGASSGTGASYGWSIDMVFKPRSVQTWSKLFDLGTGAYIDSMYLGWFSNANYMEFGQFVTVQNALGGSSSGNWYPVLLTPNINQWYHFTWVMQPLSTDYTFTSPTATTVANWTVYINGARVGTTTTGNSGTPLPIFRHVSYLARSDWWQEGNADAMANCTYDAFRIWDRALTGSQVVGLAALYGISSNTPAVTNVTGVSAGGDFGLTAALAGGAAPVFNADFRQNPTTIPSVGPTINYAWAPVDTSDTAADQGVHQGLAVLSGLFTSFINISTANGPNSCGLVAPIIGGPGSGTGATQGWSFEFVWKPTGESTTWAKLLDMGNGASNGYAQTTNDDWTIGFDGNDQTEFLVETYNSGTPQYPHAFTELRELTLGTWYHMVVVNTPVGNAGAANWYIYVNGVLENWASPLNNGVPVTTVPQQGANYPLPVVRGQSYIGKSDWADPLLAALVDAVRIYDYALSATQVSSLAALYNLNKPSPYPAPGTVAPGFSASAAEYSIYTQAGINFAPYFNAPFATNPASLVGGTTGYVWMQSDPADTPAVQAFHQGVVQMSATPTSYIDLTLVSGPQSIGQSLPILFGASSGSGSSYGWSIDMVFKPRSVQTWSKFFDLGTGAAIDSMYLGWVGSSNTWEFGQFVQSTQALGGGNGGNNGNWFTIVNAPRLNTWYHFAWVMQPRSTDYTLTSASASTVANWTLYINGQAIVRGATTNPNGVPLPIYRHVSYIGRSDWWQEGAGDAMINATYDAFRVWDRALTASQVVGLATAYGTNGNFVEDGGDFGLRSALGASAKLPVFNANFSQNPQSMAGIGATNYGWIPWDSTDSQTNQGLHTGLAVLQGATNALSWIDVTTATGPQSCGQVMPVIGGPGSGTGATQGWSFEFVFKPSAAEYRTWAKLLDLGNGPVAAPYGTAMPPSNDDWTIGFDGNDQTKFLVETYNSGTLAYTHAFIETEAIQPGQWYHMTVVITPAPAAQAALGGANWYVYVNGQLQNWAYPLNGGLPLSLSYLQGANYPQPVARPNSYIGKSDWADPVMDAIVDAVRVYDYALSTAQVQALAALYNLNSSTPTFPPAGSVAPGFTSTAAEYTAYTAAGISFAPYFNAPFATDPTPLVGGSTGYTWLAADPADSAAQQALHRGVIRCNAAATSFVDLAQVTGPNSIGQTLPILFGASSGTGASYGWSVELVVKPLAVQTWSKLIDLGTGAYIDSMYFGWQSNNNLWEFGQYVTIQNALAFPVNTSGTSFGVFTNILEQPVIGQWYHLVWVMQPVSTDVTFATPSASAQAQWSVYVNGQLAASLLGNTPLPVFRHVSYIGRSDWYQAGNGDANTNAAYDAFRIWDRALSQAQVTGLANTLYQLGLPPAATSVSAGGDFGLQGALGSGQKLPVFNANFNQNPSTIAGVGPLLSYNWIPFDPSDTTSDQGVHQGLAVLTGTPLSFINISTATGPNSCGLVAPMIGTASSGSGAAQGWSFEFVWKPQGEARTWAKLLDMGNGAATGGYVTPGNDDWTLGFDGNDQTQFLFETYNSGTPLYSHAYTELQALTIGQWYHMVVVNTPVGNSGAANWYIYVGGQLLNWAYPLSGGIPVTTVPQQGANYPQPVVRGQSYIGKSNWNDPTLIATIDAVRIYDYALSQTQVTALATLYNLQLPSAPYAAPGSTASGFSSSAAEYSRAAQAGINFSPVFNAAFATNPASLVGGTTAYTWLATDPTDSPAVQAYHTGLIAMNGTPLQFIDVTQTTGPNSIGQTLPILFGASGGSGVSYGWTIEFVIKPRSVQTWSKLFDFGTGAYIDSMYFGWQSSNNLWEAGDYITVANSLIGGAGSQGSSSGKFTNFLSAPVLGQWYHLAWVLQPRSTDATFATASASTVATWTIYVNGQVAVQNFTGNMPLPVYRHVSYIGRSDWFQAGNGDANTNATYDAFRVWDRALSQAQVQAMAQTYGLWTPPQTGYLCLLTYALPGNIDYPWSTALSLQVSYDPTLRTSAVGTGVQVQSVSGTRVYTNRFGAQVNALVSLASPSLSPTANLLYLGAALPMDTTGLTLQYSPAVQLPGVGPNPTFTQVQLRNQQGLIVEGATTRVDAQGEAYLSNIPGFVNQTIGASNINALAANYAACTAPITFTNGLRAPTQPSASNGATRFAYNYVISDGVTYSIQGSLIIICSSAFATAKDLLGNPYQTITNVTGTRVYTYLPTGATLTSTINGLSTAVNANADQRFYPYALLASSPGVYTMATAPFLDNDGLEFSVSPSIPQNGLAPGVGTQYAATTLFFTTPEPIAVLTEGFFTALPDVKLQQQVYSLNV